MGGLFSLIKMGAIEPSRRVQTANDDNGDFKNFTQKEMFSTIEEIVPYTFKKIQIQELLTFCNSINLDGPPS